MKISGPYSEKGAQLCHQLWFNDLNISIASDSFSFVKHFLTLLLQHQEWGGTDAMDDEKSRWIRTVQACVAEYSSVI